MHVSFEAAKRLADAGFSQPVPKRGQVWFFKNGVGMVVTCGGDLLDAELCDYVTASGTLYISRHLNDGEIFAPTATDILENLPGYAVALIVDNFNGGKRQWCCWKVHTPALCFEHPTNPAEAAALAWISLPKNVCRVCGTQAVRGKALKNILAGKSEWADGSMDGATLTLSGNADFLECWKCPKCGHSWT